ncbi:hypothetical protein EYZ11_008952 [Aspergillus tanneri]|uniref:Uncharacterized protein n=1 Tax=Aspergillus tanneri TaxID=1220188 RepID=A0A4V3UNK5_9EURO|nr:hypothetical protein EYZ11_008952 [Aspergillus tanneri]
MTGEDCMIQAYDPEEKILDYQAVCQFAKLLLQLDTADRPATTLQPESEDFANARLGTTVEELLNITADVFVTTCRSPAHIWLGYYKIAHVTVKRVQDPNLRPNPRGSPE